MANQPVKHHYVPQFYLAGFTASGQRDDILHVLDKRLRRTWKARPRGVGFEEDFYSIDATAPGADGDDAVIEKKLSVLEGKWSAALKSTIDNRRLPQDDDTLGDLYQFIAFTAIRGVRIRRIISDFI